MSIKGGGKRLAKVTLDASGRKTLLHVHKPRFGRNIVLLPSWLITSIPKVLTKQDASTIAVLHVL